MDELKNQILLNNGRQVVPRGVEGHAGDGGSAASVIVLNAHVSEEEDTQVKSKQKMHKDAKATVKPHNIKEGDTFLLLRKSTKSKSPAAHGTRIKGRRGEEKGSH